MISGIPAPGAWGQVGNPARKPEYDIGINIGNYDFDGSLDEAALSNAAAKIATRDYGCENDRYYGRRGNQMGAM